MMLITNRHQYRAIDVTILANPTIRNKTETNIQTKSNTTFTYHIEHLFAISFAPKSVKTTQTKHITEQMIHSFIFQLYLKFHINNRI